MSASKRGVYGTVSVYYVWSPFIVVEPLVIQHHIDHQSMLTRLWSFKTVNIYCTILLHKMKCWMSIWLNLDGAYW